MHRQRGFTFLEIVLAIFILMLLLSLAVPSLQGVVADKRLRASLDRFNDLVRQVQEHSVTEQRGYLIVCGEKKITLRPETPSKNEEQNPTREYKLNGSDALTLSLPVALAKKPAGEWIFWPSGTCEPATIKFRGAAGTWTADYAALTCRAQLTNYATR